MNVNRKVIKIDIEDVQPGVEFWELIFNLLCYGANPRPIVMEGYIRRIWRNNRVDKVVMLKEGAFIVRFFLRWSEEIKFWQEI